jgi:hypothetical protein
MYTQSTQKKFGLSTLGALLLTLLLSSCAIMQAQQSKDTEKLLSAAGFKMTLANSPEKLDHLKTLTQNKLVAHTKDAVVYYTYADATNCQCFYVGSDKAYQSFLKLQEQQNLAAEDRMSAQMDSEENLNWDTMGYGMSGNSMGFINQP